MKTSFEGLSSLVLVDLLAALPQDFVMKVVFWGNRRLRQTCCLKWVTDRMTEIDFVWFVDASLIGGDVETNFCIGSIMKRAYGIVDIDSIERTFGNTCLSVVGKLLKQLPGPLFVTIWRDEVADSQLEPYLNNAVVAPKVFYVWERTTVRKPLRSLVGVASNLIFYYVSVGIERFNSVDCQPLLHSVYYRSALLNGRHIIDVVRTICGLESRSDKEEEVQRVRREVTASAEEVEGYRGLWLASWNGYKIGWTSRNGY